MEEQEIRDKATAIGWRPEEEFKGDPALWVDAAEYLRRGEEVLPLVKAENRRMHERQDKLTAEISRLAAVVGEQRKSMDDMAKFNLQQLADKLTEQKRQLTAQLREARKDEDNSLVEDLEEQLEENTEARGKVKDVVAAQAAKPAPQTQQQAAVETPEYKEWAAANPWFGGTSLADDAKSAVAMRLGAKATAAGKTGKAFFEAVDEGLAELYPAAPKRKDPTEDGRPSGGSGSTSSSDSGFKGLPPEAKAKAKEQSARFVGPNKMFKTEPDWFAYYAKQYNTEAA